MESLQSPLRIKILRNKNDQPIGANLVVDERLATH